MKLSERLAAAARIGCRPSQEDVVEAQRLEAWELKSRIVARATNPQTGETCEISLSLSQVSHLTELLKVKGEKASTEELLRILSQDQIRDLGIGAEAAHETGTKST